MLSFDIYVYSQHAQLHGRDLVRKNTAFTGPEHYFNISEAKRCNISIPEPVS